MNISIHTDNPLHAALRQFFPDEGTSEKAALAIVQPNTDERRQAAIAYLRQKTPVALLGVTEDSFDFLPLAAATAHRNHLPLILLGSWRYIPAVAALKEIVSSNCLGLITSVSATAVSGASANAFLNDIAHWLAPGLQIAQDTASAVHGVRVSISATNGTVSADFSLDGASATFDACLLGHQRTRTIPSADPLTSELSILKLYLKSEKKLKKAPLLMTL